MTAQGNKSDVPWPVTALLILLAVVFLKWLYEKVMAFYYWCKAAAITLGTICGWILLGLLAAIAALFLVALLVDLTAPLRRRWASRRKFRKSIAACPLPRLSTFQGVCEGHLPPDTEPIDAALAKVLADRYRSLTGRTPDSSSFAGRPGEFALFRSRQGPKALLSSHREWVEQALFVPTHQAYRSGEHPAINKWVDTALESAKKRHPLAASGRLLHFLSFRKLGLTAEQAWRQPKLAELQADFQAFLEVCRAHFFVTLPPIKLELDIKGLINAVDHHADHPADSPAGLLPESCEVIEAEWQPKPAEEEGAGQGRGVDLAAEAVAAVQAFDQGLEADGPQWGNPAEFFDEGYQVLTGLVAYHPNPDEVHERIAVLKQRRVRLASFDDEFEHQMRNELADGEPWPTVWLEQAGKEFPTDFLTNEDCQKFRQIACRHFVTAEPVDNVQPDKVPQPDLPEVSKPKQRGSNGASTHAAALGF